MFQSLYLENYFCFIIYFLQGFSVTLSFESSSSVHFSFLCLCEFRWKMCLLWSWGSILMWEHPYADCTCPVSLAGGLDLMWVPIASFLRVCWHLSLWWEVWLLMEELEPAHGMRWDFSGHWMSPPCQGWDLLPSGQSRILEVQARTGSVSLSMYFYFSLHWGLCPKGGESCSKWSCIFADV